MLDLDLTVSPPKKFKFRDTIYLVKEPTVEQLIKHGQLIDQLTDLRKALDFLEKDEKKDDILYEEKLKEYRNVNRGFDKRLIEIFVPDFIDEFDRLTTTQRDKLVNLILDIPDNEKKTESESEIGET